MAKFLDDTGLQALINKIKGSFIPNEGNTKTGSLSITRSGDIDLESSAGSMSFEADGDISTHAAGNYTLQSGDTYIQIDGRADHAYYTKGTATTTANDEIATIGDVTSRIQESDAMQYRGSINQSSDLPTVSNTTNNIKVGATYKVATAGTYSYYNGTSTIQQACKIGDLFIAQSIPSTGTKTITWDFIPSADETETSVALTNSTPSISTTPQTGPVTFGQAAAKQVDTSISANSTSTNLPTSEAVANYALKNVTNSYGIHVGTKEDGEQSIEVYLGCGGTGLGFVSSGPSAGALTVNAGSGITTSTGDVAINADSTKGLSFDNNGKLIVKIKPTNSGLAVDGSGIRVNTSDGLTVDNNNIKIKLSEEDVPIDGDTLNINTSGLTITNNGDLKINAGSGLVNYHLIGSELTAGLAINNGNGLSFDNSGKLIVQANPTNSGLAIDSSGVSVVANTAKGLYIQGSGIGINLGCGYTGLTFKDGGLLTVNAGSGLILNEDTGNKVKVNNGNGISFDNTGKLQVQAKSTNSGLLVNGSGVSLKLDTTNANGLAITSSGLKLNTATTSTAGAMSSTDKAKLDLLQALPTAVGTYTYNVTTAGTAGAYTAMQFVSTTDIDNMWTGTYTA